MARLVQAPGQVHVFSEGAVGPTPLGPEDLRPVHREAPRGDERLPVVVLQLLVVGKCEQVYYGKPLISSGCFSMYRTEILGAQGGWSNRTLAEDVDLTWSLYQAGHEVRFVPEAVCYPIEPRSFTLMGKQLRRWSHGFVQNVKLHWRGLLTVPYLRSAVAVAFWDATLATAVYLVVLPMLAIVLARPWVLIGYGTDAPAVLVPVLAGAMRRREVRRALASVPAFFVLRTVNAVFFLRAVCAELLLGRSLRVYAKGH